MRKKKYFEVVRFILLFSSLTSSYTTYATETTNVQLKENLDSVEMATLRKITRNSKMNCVKERRYRNSDNGRKKPRTPRILELKK